MVKNDEECPHCGSGGKDYDKWGSPFECALCEGTGKVSKERKRWYKNHIIYHEPDQKLPWDTPS